MSRRGRVSRSPRARSVSRPSWRARMGGSGSLLGIIINYYSTPAYRALAALSSVRSVWRAALSSSRLPASGGLFRMPQPAPLRIGGARQNNLTNISVEIPHDRLTVVTDVSGSGKSSLAFDTLFAEGQWRYIESLSTYARMFLERIDRPDVDRIEQIRPAVALEQKNPVRTARSTVGTATEIYDYLRLLYAKVGRVHCAACGAPAASHHSATTIADALLGEHPGARALVTFPLPAPTR